MGTRLLVTTGFVGTVIHYFWFILIDFRIPCLGDLSRWAIVDTSSFKSEVQLNPFNSHLGLRGTCSIATLLFRCFMAMNRAMHLQTQYRTTRVERLSCLRKFFIKSTRLINIEPQRSQFTLLQRGLGYQLRRGEFSRLV